MKKPHVLRSFQIGGLLISEQEDGEHISIRQIADPACLNEDQFNALASLRFEGLFQEVAE